MQPVGPPLLDRVRHAIRAKHYSLRTEQTFVEWIKRYVLHPGKRHPSDLGAADIEAFLTHLAVEGRVAAATQNQAKAALLFLYREVLGIELPWLDGIVRARMPVRLPAVLTEAEVAAILAELHGVNRLIGQPLYGAGLRIMEAVRLRILDVLQRREFLVRNGKGQKDRITMLPASAAGGLARQIERSRRMHADDLDMGGGDVGCRMRSPASGRTRAASGAGNTSFPTSRLT